MLTKKKPQTDKNVPSFNGGKHGARFALACLSAAVALLLLTSRAAHAEEGLNLPSLWAAADTNKTDARGTPQPNPLWDSGVGKSYWIPALEIIGFDLLLNQFNRNFLPDPAYNTSLSSVWRNLTHGWVYDNDGFTVNQIGHPYQGSMYHGFARSTGHGFWSSMGYAFAGSLFWEIAGETTPPSKNDQVASGIGGSFLGEPLFRMAHLVLEKGQASRPWRELGAAVLSPPTGFNRLAFGNRFDSIFNSNDPAYTWRLQAGGGLQALMKEGISTEFIRNEALLDYQMDYGLPGKSDYSYSRPFDYFSFQITFTSANAIDNVLAHGLLLGKEFESAHTRGIWGIYGSFNYIAPQVFRISSTAVSLGATSQTWLSKSIALQSTALLGVGYAAAGTIHGVGERDYHYGVTPQALLALRLIFGGRAMAELTARGYFVTDALSPEDRGIEKIARVEAGYTLRVYKQHAVAARFTYSRRDADYPDLGDRTQSRGVVGLFYTYLGGSTNNFGAVDWR